MCVCVLRKAAGAVTLVREDACVYASVLWKAPCLNFLSEPLPDVELLRAAEGGRCLCGYFKPKQLQRIDSDISAYCDSSLMLLLLLGTVVFLSAALMCLILTMIHNVVFILN